MAFSQLSPMIQNQIRRNPTNLARAVRRPVRPTSGVKWSNIKHARPKQATGTGWGPVAKPHAAARVEANHPLGGAGGTTTAGSGGVLSGPTNLGPIAPLPASPAEPAPQLPTVDPPFKWLDPYKPYVGFNDWWGTHQNQYKEADGDQQLAGILKSFQDDSWKTKTTDFSTWLNSQPNIGLLAQNFDAQKAAYIAAHGGQAGQVLGQGYANLYDPKYMQAVSELLLKGGNTNTAPMSEMAGLMTQNASGISPYAAAMLENLRKHSASTGSNAANLARRGLYGGGGALDYAQAGVGAALQSANQTASQTWGPDRIAALGQQIVQNLQSLNTDQYAALSDALSRGLGGIPNPVVTGGIPDWTKLLGQWGSV